jgi:hypothetical protein
MEILLGVLSWTNRNAFVSLVYCHPKNSLTSSGLPMPHPGRTVCTTPFRVAFHASQKFTHTFCNVFSVWRFVFSVWRFLCEDKTHCALDLKYTAYALELGKVLILYTWNMMYWLCCWTRARWRRLWPKMLVAYVLVLKCIVCVFDSKRNGQYINLWRWRTWSVKCFWPTILWWTSLPLKVLEWLRRQVSFTLAVYVCGGWLARTSGLLLLHNYPLPLIYPHLSTHSLCTSLQMIEGDNTNQAVLSPEALK